MTAIDLTRRTTLASLGVAAATVIHVQATNPVQANEGSIDLETPGEN